MRRVATPLGRDAAGVAVLGLVLGLVVLALVAGVPVPVGAHVDDLGVDAQVSADGTVVVETVFIGTDGFVVLHEANGSGPGEPIGHAAVSEADAFEEDVPVDVAAETWRNWSGRRLWAVLHADDGDGTFEPGEDEMIEQFGDPAGERFTLARGDAPAYVTAREFSAQETDDGTVRVRVAALPVGGHVVLRAATGDGPGRVVGSTAVPAGTTRNVTVAMDEGFFRDREGSFTLYAALHGDDGDGAFDGADDPIVAGSEPVATRFGVEKTGGPTTTASATGEGHDPGTGGHAHEHDDGHDHSPTGTATDGGDGARDVSARDGAGFGGLAALVAVSLLVATYRRRL